MAKKAKVLEEVNLEGIVVSPPDSKVEAVAIVGSHPYTCDYAPWDDESVHIWGFNKHAMGMKRLSACFQMHTPKIYMEKYGEDYVKWLQGGIGVPLYMRYPEASFPDAVEYPVEKIYSLTDHVLQGQDKGFSEKSLDLQPLRYFTSSITYAVSLAILLEYKKILVYGVEMHTRFDWYYQRENFMFWIGFAAGQGINLEIHCANGMFRQPLYETGFSQYQDETE